MLRAGGHDPDRTQMTSFLNLTETILAVIGALTLIVGALILLIRRFDVLWDLTVARVLKLAEPLGKRVKSYRLKSDVQGHLNKWIEILNKRLPLGVAIPKIRVHFHDAESSLDVLQNGDLLLLFNYNAEPAENYSKATQWVVGATALPHAYRPYLKPVITEAFELSVARLMLRDQNAPALAAFNRHAYEPAIERDPKISHYCARFETIDDAGFFTRILWPELNDFGRQCVGRLPSRRLKDESSAFVHWLHAMAARPKGAQVPLRYESLLINVAFHLIRDEAKALSLDVYAGHIEDDLRDGIPRIYLCARGRSITAVRELASRFRRYGDVKQVKIYEYDQALIERSVMDEVLRGDIVLPRRGGLKHYVAEPEEEDAGPPSGRFSIRAVCAIIYHVAPKAASGLKEEVEDLDAEPARSG